MVNGLVPENHVRPAPEPVQEADCEPAAFGDFVSMVRRTGTFGSDAAGDKAKVPKFGGICAGGASAEVRTSHMG